VNVDIRKVIIIMVVVGVGIMKKDANVKSLKKQKNK